MHEFTTAYLQPRVIQKFDAVRVITPQHPYQGFTGRVCQIDTSLKGNPVVEVRLDQVRRRHI